MEAWFHAFAAGVSLLLDALVIVSVCAGAGVAIYGTLRYVTTGVHPTGNRRGIWMGFARWLMLALEFALAADLVDTAIAPSWDQIGQLAAIAAIRTGLGFFLERDIDAVRPAEG
ncbi:MULTISPECIES: DUF1622 domain-containing protein [Sphingomonas]|uniref:DUF1622 domain-containing protein n=1 Tax=Sphingomonas TaxID=13687 RepID=UPI000F7E5D94|nr:DUF1622 domain-containing protein [Sphingomonas sp. ABOLF]RSV17490.1 DUF1622 domain-containing protein [Sphingomonas sp. ABOLF]GLK19987.1 hypothetical protein GCM10017606_08130 [Microbacterium terregens]